jgi:hypothetical protein
MSYLQKMAITKAIELLDSAKMKYASEASVNAAMRSEVFTDLYESKRWLQAIIDDAEDETAEDA